MKKEEAGQEWMVKKLQSEPEFVEHLGQFIRSLLDRQRLAIEKGEDTLQ